MGTPAGVRPGQHVPGRVESYDALDGSHYVAPCHLHRGGLLGAAVDAVQVDLRLGRKPPESTATRARGVVRTPMYVLLDSVLSV